MPLLAKIHLQVLYMPRCINLQIQDLLKKDKNRRPYRRLKKCIHQKNSYAVAGFSNLKRSFLNMVRGTKSFRRSAMQKKKAKMIGLLQVGDILILKKSQNSTRTHILIMIDLRGIASLRNTICNKVFFICPEYYVFSLK